jgi:hypothetical protein
MNKRLVVALAIYVILGSIAAVVLSGKLLIAILGLFALLAVRTLIAAKAGWHL